MNIQRLSLSCLPALAQALAQALALVPAHAQCPVQYQRLAADKTPPRRTPVRQYEQLTININI